MQSFLSNLTFPRKFALIGFVALLLLAVPATLLFKTLSGALASAERERQALAPAAAVLKLVQLTQQHRGLTAGVLAGQTAAVAPRQAKQVEVDEAWARVHKELLAFGDARLQKKAASTAQAWAALVQAVSAQALQAPQSFARHTALVSQKLALLQALAVESGIARHHQLSGYQLQMAVLGHLPRLSETMGQLRARANAVLVRGTVAAEDRLRLGALLAQSRQASAELGSVLEDLRRTSPAQGQRVDGAAAALFSAAEQVLMLAQTDIIDAETVSLQAPLFWTRITQAIDQQFDFSKTLFAELDQEITGTRDGVVRQMFAVAALVLALAALGAWLLFTVARGVQRSVQQAVQLTQAVAAGDLSTPAPVPTGDELGQLLQSLARMQQALSVVVGSVRRNADSVATASAQIAQGNLDLSSRTEEQASALQQTAATMDELGSTVRNNADNSRQADALALSAASIAIKGGEMVNQVVQTMHGINESSRQIAEIISVIDGIAFQTNILALNAAVEAARAGEQGRGFAVVASEVRTLAQRSAQAARQIKDLISTSVQRVEQGSALVDEAGHTMQGIVSAIDRVKAIVGEISNASTEQSQGVTQIGQAVSQMDQATQRNAALVEESAAAAQNLKEQAQALVSAVSAFRLAL